uniref:Uncharacterized protein n=1 Tax=Brassica oleracea TaxID=3712 RepID=A0A3P6DW09_BRAOL|nr:unnamed protein product [Brassica oleracea]
MSNGDKESSDLFYGWGDMGNFEDGDNMLSESNYAVEDENGYTIMGGSAQENSSENVYDTSLLEKDILMLDEEVNCLDIKQTISIRSPSLINQSQYQNHSKTINHTNASQETWKSSLSNILPPKLELGFSHDHHANKDSHRHKISPGKRFDDPATSRSSTYTTTTNRPDLSSLRYKDAGFVITLLDLLSCGSCRSSSTSLLLPSASSLPSSSLSSISTSSYVALLVASKPFRLIEKVPELFSLSGISFPHFQLLVSSKITSRFTITLLVVGSRSRYVGFMDIETDTDPIDRSIAHLLFHRPSDASLSSDRDVLSYKTHQMIPHPNSSPSLRIEKEEETREQLGTEAEGVASIHVRNKSPDSNTWLPL